MWRSLLYIVIVVNLAYFGWHLSRKRSTPLERQTATVLINSDRIRVVRPERLLPPSGAPVNNRSQPTTVLNPPASPSGAGAAKPADDTVVTTTAGLKQRRTKVSVRAPSPEAAAPTSAARDATRVLKTHRLAGDKRAEKVKQNQQAEVCWLTPALSSAQLEDWDQALAVAGYPSRRLSELRAEPTGYLVLIRPLTSTSAATEATAVAKGQHLDAFVLNRGEWKRGVSLGIFSQRGNAQAMLQRARKQLPDYDIGIVPRVRQRKISRLLFALPPQVNPLDLLPAGGEPSSASMSSGGLIKKSCQGVEF